MSGEPLTVVEASEKFGVSARTLRYWINLGWLPAVQREGAGRMRSAYLVDPDDVRAAMERSAAGRTRRWEK